MGKCKGEDWIVHGSGGSIGGLDIRWFWEKCQFAG